jgi:HD-like signal output (HDOD) protein
MTNPVSDQELASAIEKLPPVSPVLQRLMFVLDDPHSDLDDISRLVRTDTALSTKVLRLANSAHFGLPEKVAAVEEAIQHIGVLETNRLVTSLGSRALFERTLELYGITSEVFWQHTLAVAVAAETIAGNLGANRSAAYIAGMLHPLGFVALDSVAAGRGMEKRSAGFPLLDWERDNFGMDNSEAASRALHLWKFPETLLEAVGSRYVPPQPGNGASTAAVLHVACCFAERMNAGLPPEGGLFRSFTERAATIGIAKADHDDVEAQIRQNLTRTRTLLKLA